MKKSAFISVLIVFVLVISIFAQSSSISGIITNEKGLPLENAEIKISGTNQMVVTNSKGYFNLNTKPGIYELSVSHPVMKDANIFVKSSEEVYLTLDPKEIECFLDKSLEELISLQ